MITGITAGSDSGTPGDGITNNPKPTIIGTAEANSTISVFADVGSGPVLARDDDGRRHRQLVIHARDDSHRRNVFDYGDRH